MNIPSFKEARLWIIVQAIFELAQGRNNATGVVTATVNAASTTVLSGVVTENDAILLMPTTGAAAAEIGAGTAYVSAQQKGQFTLSHGNNATAGRTFRYAVFGS
jgi:hypothetical protein